MKQLQLDKVQDANEPWDLDEELDEQVVRFLTMDEVPEDIKNYYRDDASIERWIQENPIKDEK
jgi:hypothetical protein